MNNELIGALERLAQNPDWLYYKKFLQTNRLDSILRTMTNSMKPLDELRLYQGRAQELRNIIDLDVSTMQADKNESSRSRNPDPYDYKD